MLLIVVGVRNQMRMVRQDVEIIIIWYCVYNHQEINGSTTVWGWDKYVNHIIVVLGAIHMNLRLHYTASDSMLDGGENCWQTTTWYTNKNPYYSYRNL